MLGEALIAIDDPQTNLQPSIGNTIFPHLDYRPPGIVDHYTGLRRAGADART